MMSPFRWLTLAAAVTIAAAPVAMAAEDIGAIAVKRYFLAQADARCHLLDAATASALKAGYIQARNSALRNGYTMAQISPWLARARTAAANASCQAPEIASEAQLARSGFRGFLAQTSLYLPSQRTAWRASRAFGDKTEWRLVQYQNVAGTDAALGLYGTLAHNSFSVMAAFADGAHPYSARLLVRDPSVNVIGLINPAPYALSQTMPQGVSETGFVSFTAQDTGDANALLSPQVTTNSAGYSLTGDYVGEQGPVDALRFDFPTRAFSAMARLDPREDVIVVFESEDGPRYLRFEVGDFITGLTYIGLPSPYGGKI